MDKSIENKGVKEKIGLNFNKVLLMQSRYIQKNTMWMMHQSL